MDTNIQKLALATLASCLVSTTSAALYSQPVSTNNGLIQGYPAFNSSTGNFTNWKNIAVWKNIPFAASTAGSNRWKAPQPASAWNSTLDAKDFGNVCPGSSSTTDYTYSEDCLNLNVWSAANSTSAKLPVVMWSYPAGSTARDDLFNGAGMADAGVVFVNYNYRTGILGWLSHAQLSEEMYASTGTNSSGNWGMLDQFAALKWIHENIAAFGGDPDQITVMGQSAGSAATQHILNSNLTKGLFVGAIIESGVREPYDPLCDSLAEAYLTLDTAEANGATIFTEYNSTTIEEMRALSWADLITSNPPPGQDTTQNLAFDAVLDYYAMPDTYYNTLVKGLASDVPVLTGNTKDESGATYGLNITLAAYIDDLNTTYGAEWADKFLAQYSANDSATASAAYNAQWTDRSKVGTWMWAGLWATAHQSAVYTYLWDHAPPGGQGASHESEINYVLNNLFDTDSAWNATDYAIAKTMNTYWVNFIKTGNPNGAGLVDWVATVNSSLTVQRLGDGWESIPVASESQVELFNEWFVTLDLH